MRMLRTVLVTTLTVAHVAEGFGTGGADSGVGQSCKVIDLCPLRAWSATDVVRICPDGMTSVGAAQTGNVDPMDPNSARQEIYTLRSGDAQPFKTNAASDPKTYSPVRCRFRLALVASSNPSLAHTHARRLSHSPR